MKKNILVIGSGEYQLCGIKKLQEKGYNVIAIDGNSNSVGKDIANKFFCIDINNPNDILKKLSTEKINISSAMCFSTEIALRSVAYINNKLNLPGITIEEALISTNKALQRKIMEEANLPCPKYLKISKKDITNFDTLSLIYPVIIKPTDNAGSRGVSLIRNKKELKNKIKETLSYSKYDSQIIIEEFIPGIEFTVETLIIDSKHYFLGISEKKKPNNNFTVSTELFYNSPLVLKLRSQIEDTTSTFLTKAKFNNTITHTEVIFSFQNQNIYIIESTVRSGGFKIFDGVLPNITGLDIVGLTIDTLLGQKPTLKKIQHKSCILGFFHNNKGILNKINILDEALPSLIKSEFNFFVKEGDEINNLESDGSRLGYYIVHGNNWQVVLKTARQIEYAVRFEILT